MCGMTREIDDFPMLIILRCDDDDYEPGYHRDSIHNVFWPIEEADVFASPIPVLPPKILHERVSIDA